MLISKIISTIPFKSGYPLGPGGMYFKKEKLEGYPYPHVWEPVKEEKTNEMDYLV